MAVILDIKNGFFIVLDLLQQNSSIVEKSFQTWLIYYNSRHSTLDITWEIKKLDHPIQTDHFNCGVYVIHFIKSFLNGDFKQNKISFDCSPISLECDRQLISTAIETYKKI